MELFFQRNRMISFHEETNGLSTRVLTYTNTCLHNFALAPAIVDYPLTNIYFGAVTVIRIVPSLKGLYVKIVMSTPFPYSIACTTPLASL